MRRRPKPEPSEPNRPAESKEPNEPNERNDAEGQSLRLDPAAEAATPGLPAFLARPSGAPVYHGFAIIEESEVDGFRLGMITDFAEPPVTCGDAFVVAPDDSRCGLVWESEVVTPYVREVLPCDDRRWGVWAVGFREPLRGPEDAPDVLKALLPELRPHWEGWKADHGGEPAEPSASESEAGAESGVDALETQESSD